MFGIVRHAGEVEVEVNIVKTAVLLAALTALFGAVGYGLGGGTGMIVALGLAAAANLYAYWNSDRLALSAHGAQEVDERTAPDLVRIVRELAARAGGADPARLLARRSPAERLRDRARPEHSAVAVSAGSCASSPGTRSRAWWRTSSLTSATATPSS
jgi:heat shock protein HtpX